MRKTFVAVAVLAALAYGPGLVVVPDPGPTDTGPKAVPTASTEEAVPHPTPAPPPAR